jgi:cobalt-zinc-cadmium efflux system protein
MQQQKSYVFNNRFVLSIALNASFVFVELFYGFRANSVALIADAVHNAADVFGLTLIWFSYYMAKREAPHRFTYGYKTATILAAFINTLVIFVAVGNLVLVSITRFYHPQAVMSYTMIIVAAAAVVIHSLSAVMFLQGRHDDVNILGVFINMAMDAAVAFAVVRSSNGLGNCGGDSSWLVGVIQRVD